MNQRTTFGLILGAVLSAALLLSAHSEAQTTPPMKLAVVDIQRAVMETEDGLRAQATLRKFFDRRQGELNARQEELGRKREDIDRQAKLVSAQALERMMGEWQKQMTELQGLYSDYNRELTKKQGEITAPIYGRINGLLTKVAKKDGWDLILERQAVPYARTDLDVTDQLITMYNAGEEPVGAPPGAASSSPIAPMPPPVAPPGVTPAPAPQAP